MAPTPAAAAVGSSAPRPADSPLVPLPEVTGTVSGGGRAASGSGRHRSRPRPGPPPPAYLRSDVANLAVRAAALGSAAVVRGRYPRRGGVRGRRDGRKLQSGGGEDGGEMGGAKRRR